MTRRSASALCSRRTWRIDQLSKRPQRRLHLAVELPHCRVLDLVPPFDLADDQLRVADQLQLAGAVRRGQLDAQQQRPVLGDVVGRAADPLAALLEHLATGVADDGADRRRPGIAPGAAVDVDDQLRHLDAIAVGDSPRAAGRLDPPARCSRSTARGAVELSISLPLLELNTARAVADVDPPLVPGELPGDRDPHLVGAPAAAPIETWGSPRVRVRPATVRAGLAGVEARRRPAELPRRRTPTLGRGAVRRRPPTAAALTSCCEAGTSAASRPWCAAARPATR